MKRAFELAGLLLVLAISPALAQFEGPLELRPQGCQATGECTLAFNLRYKDPNGLVWQAAADNKTDGASIPKWARPFIGDPFNPSYLKAAVIHDHYCDRHVRPWRATHRMFYDALRELGMELPKAKLMYYAVFLGGPKWVKLIPGRDCPGNCRFSVQIEGVPEFDELAKPEGAAQLEGEVDLIEPQVSTIIARPAAFDDVGFEAELKEVERLIAEGGDAITLEALEQRASEKRPGDFFYENQGEVSIDSGFAFQ